jgi:hypothetical protein
VAAAAFFDLKWRTIFCKRKSQADSKKVVKDDNAAPYYIVKATQ